MVRKFILHPNLLNKPMLCPFVLTTSFGSVTNNTFGNVNIVYGIVFPLKIGFFHMTLSNYVHHIHFSRYYRVDNQPSIFIVTKSYNNFSYDFLLIGN